MSIIKDLTSKDFVRVDKKAYTILSKNALYVYIIFGSLHQNCDPTDAYMCKKCEMSIKTYKKAKKELKDNNFLYVRRLGAQGAKIEYYLGERAVKQIKKYLQTRKEQYLPLS